MFLKVLYFILVLFLLSNTFLTDRIENRIGAAENGDAKFWELEETRLTTQNLNNKIPEEQCQYFFSLKELFSLYSQMSIVRSPPSHIYSFF